jgi:hypothetical protein
MMGGEHSRKEPFKQLVNFEDLRIPGQIIEEMGPGLENFNDKKSPCSCRQFCYSADSAISQFSCLANPVLSLSVYPPKGLAATCRSF